MKDNAHDKKKKENVEFKNVKEALTWTEKQKSQVKNGKSKYDQSEYRDCFRAFLESPDKVMDENNILGDNSYPGADHSGMPDNYSACVEHDQDYRSLGENFAFVPGKHVTILDRAALSNMDSATKKDKKKKILTPA